MKKHSLSWWIFIGWWWYLCVALWLYPIKWFLSGKLSNVSLDADNDNQYRLMRETEENIIDFLEKSGGTALQVDIKKSLPGRLMPCFDAAVHELYENGKIKTLKDGNRIRLELA